MSNDSIPAIQNYGYNPYFMSAYNSYNANAQQAQATQQQATQAQAAQQQTASTPSQDVSNVTNVQYQDPSFKGNSEAVVKSSSHTGLYVAGTVVAGAATLLYASKKGDGKGIKAGFKNIWNSMKNAFSSKASAETTSSVGHRLGSFISENGSKVQEYTIRKGENIFVIKDNKIAKIITKDKKTITKSDEVTNWLNNNGEFKKEYDNILDQVNKGALDKEGNNILGKLPKGVQVSYEKTIKDPKGIEYRYVIENGKTKQVFKVDGSSTKDTEIKGDSLKGFLKNHKKMTEEAETLKQSWTGEKIRLYDKKDKIIETTQNVQIEVRNNKIVKATIGSGSKARELTDKELKLLNQDYKRKVQDFAKQKDSYSDIPCNYTYRAKGGQVIKFDETGKVTEISGSSTKDLEGTDVVESWLKKNDSIKNEIDDIIKTGQTPAGYQITNAIFKSESGNVFEIVGNKIKGVKLKEDFTYKNSKGKDITFKAGDTLDKEALQAWRKEVAENNNEYKSILEKLKNE